MNLERSSENILPFPTAPAIFHHSLRQQFSDQSVDMVKGQAGEGREIAKKGRLFSAEIVPQKEFERQGRECLDLFRYGAK